MKLIAPCYLTNHKDYLLVYMAAREYKRRLPGCEYYIVNTGPFLAESEAEEDIVFIAKPELASTIPSVGEARMLKFFFENLCVDNDQILKVHAKCIIKNVEIFCRSFEEDHSFQGIIRKNIFADVVSRQVNRCYVDTRIFCSSARFGRNMFNHITECYDVLGSSLELEQLVFNYIHQLNDWESEKIKFLYTRPDITGLSGHGRSYDSLSFKAKNIINTYLSYVGLS